MSAPTAHELVAKGAALLDEKLPGWADQIDLDSLEMSDTCLCVLGQIGKDRVNLDKLSWDGPGTTDYYGVRNLLKVRASDFGFDAEPASFVELQDAWKGAIVARRTL